MDSVNSGIGGTQGSFGDPATFAYPLGVNLDLPQAYDDDEYYEDEDELSDAQAEWEESLRQLEDLVSLILVPFAGKFFGRKFSNYLWSMYCVKRYTEDGRIKNNLEYNLTGLLSSASN